MGMARLRGQGAISALVLVLGATVTSAVTTTYAIGTIEETLPWERAVSGDSHANILLQRRKKGAGVSRARARCGAGNPGQVSIFERGSFGV
jgi:hypothetical protein